ncbi:uncharacterized protein LOC105445490 [Strongylocentrotus purpuratus]|uniref:Uncharacterized protein n=1 Tax=Strongylocentrotus purpuratus TaxID=7668 RepID=A0A7M7NJ40_STRPU|nr:uncharacterized protein LOC105445490 [Strongylocentrotus purpuratus]
MASPSGSTKQKTSETLSTAKAGTSPGETAAGPSTKPEPKRSSAVKSSDTKRKSVLAKPAPNESKNSGPKKKGKKPEEKEDFTDLRGRLDKLESLMERMVDFLPCQSATRPTGDTPPTACTAATNVRFLQVEHDDDDFEHIDTGNMGQCPTSYDIGSMDEGDVNETVAPGLDQENEDKLEENVLEEAGGKYPPPSNCTPLCCPKVNAAIWENLSSHTRSRDLKLQRIQKPLTRGLTAFIQTLSPDSLSETQQDALALLCNTNFEINCLRKDQIKPDLNAKYSHLCKPATPVSQYLFGDDLTKRVKDLTEQQKAASGVVRGQRIHPAPSTIRTGRKRPALFNTADKDGTVPPAHHKLFQVAGPQVGTTTGPFLGQRTQRGRPYRAPPHTQTMSMENRPNPSSGHRQQGGNSYTITQRGYAATLLESGTKQMNSGYHYSFMESINLQAVPLPPSRGGNGTNKTFEADKAVEFEIKSVTGDKTVSVAFAKPFAVGVTALTTIYDPGVSAKENNNVVEGVGDHTDTKLVINSIVLDIVLVDEHGVQIVLGKDEEILLTFASSEPGGFKERICRYYDEDVSKWSRFGCYVQTSNTSVVTCACNHTTSFAVLLQFEDCAIDGANLQIQTLMTRIFNSISIFALFLSVIIFTYLKLYTSDQVKVHICLAISLALAQLVMLFMGQTEHKGICRAIAGIMHYLLTAYCISMILEGTLLHRKASRTHKAPAKGWVILLCVWGIPCVMIAVMMGSVIDGYGGECACWLNVQYGTMWIWLAEVCLVVAVNTVLLSLIMRTFISLKANTKKSETDRLKATARALLIMMPMLGMTWMFALLQASFKNVFLQWLFILLNALQGPVFFVFQCVMNPEVRYI